jgi:hypothetical protein
MSTLFLWGGVLRAGHTASIRTGPHRKFASGSFTSESLSEDALDYLLYLQTLPSVLMQGFQQLPFLKFAYHSLSTLLH